MRISTAATALAACVICAAIAPPAAAQNAQQLYDEGLQAMLANNYSDGCPKLQRSYDADPALGALFTLAACYERWGKIHSASQRYKAFLDQTAALPPAEAKKQEDRMKTAVGKYDELSKQVPTLTLSFATAAPADVTVTLNDEAVPSGDLGQPQSHDPGDIRVVVTAADGQSRSYEETLAAGDSKTISLELPAPAGADEPAQQDEEEASSDGTTTTTVAFVLGGVGLAALVVGGVTGGMVFAKKGDVEDNCVDTVCTQEGKDAVDEAQTLGMVSTVMFAVGGAALAGGVLLYLLAPGESDEEQAGAPQLTVGSSQIDPMRSAIVGIKGAW